VSPTCDGPVQLCVLQQLAVESLITLDKDSYCPIIAIFAYPTCILTPPLWGGEFPLEYCHNVWYGKNRMAWLSDSETTCEDMFIRFVRIHERDGQTRMTVLATHMHSIARQKIGR